MKKVSIWFHGRFWHFALMRALVPLVAVVVAALVWLWWIWPELGTQWANADQFGLGLGGLNLSAVVVLWFMQLRHEWVEKLPKFLTVILEKPGGSGIHVIIPYLPLTSKGDIRSQAQTVFTGWYSTNRLPFENIVHEVKEQGVYRNLSGHINDGKPGMFYLVRIRLTEENAVTDRIKNAVLVQPHGHLKVAERCLLPLKDSKAWCIEPQPLKLDECVPFEKTWTQAPACEQVWLASRHAVAAEWLARQGVEVSRVIAHLDEADLKALKQAKSVCVIGNLPLHLVVAVQEAGAIYVNLNLTVPPEWRGRELTLDEFEQCAPSLRQYEVQDKGEPILPKEKRS